ncbi:hypothetical protein RclHR1_17610004 [Rhizophagus clarus]|nr:hypothetical protein RclHR1_17610004 [Rhizophagus clarus]
MSAPIIHKQDTQDDLDLKPNPLQSMVAEVKAKITGESQTITIEGNDSDVVHVFNPNGTGGTYLQEPPTLVELLRDEKEPPTYNKIQEAEKQKNDQTNLLD